MGFSLQMNELYARFFRIAERRINELGCGIVAYISNYSYVSEQSFVVMREKLLHTLDPKDRRRRQGHSANVLAIEAFLNRFPVVQPSQLLMYLPL
jgi:hypothetical protein